MNRPLKTQPTYAISSVDHALRIAGMLQLEGALSVSEAAGRLGVSRSTAHRLLQMLVYRDFAVQDADRRYRAGPVLQLAEHSGSQTARLRTASLPHLARLVGTLNETAHLTIRAGGTARFIASVECAQALRVSSREGMAFPAQDTSIGLVLLSELDDDELAFAVAPDGEPGSGTDLARLRKELARIRRSGFAVNQGRSEAGVVAVGVPVRDATGTALGGVCVSIPSTRYRKERLPVLVAALHDTANAITAGMTRE